MIARQSQPYYGQGPHSWRVRAVQQNTGSSVHDYPVIGGKADGSSVWSTAPPVVHELRGEKYVAIQFKARCKGTQEPAKLVTIYMRCGLSPENAMAIYRERFNMDTDV